MKEALYRCELVYDPDDPDATSAWRYIARAEEHGKRPDQLVYIEAGNMPAWSKVGQCGRDYWEAADRYSRVDGRRYFPIYIALPRGLSQDQHIELARAFVQAVGRMCEDPQGCLPYTFAIHRGYRRNPHAHLHVSQCINGGQSRSRELWFRRFDLGHPDRGGARKSREITRKRWLAELRATWESVANHLLAVWGTGLYIDRRSHAAKGDRRIPTLPLGPVPIPGRPNPGREQRRLRNLEIERENRRREGERLRAEDAAAEARKLAMRHADQALHQFYEHMAAENPIYGCEILENDKRRKCSLAQLRKSLLYQAVVRDELGHGWDCVMVGETPVWQHLPDAAVFDFGDRLVANQPTALAAAAIAVLAATRTTGRVVTVGPPRWHQELCRASSGRLICVDWPSPAPAAALAGNAVGSDAPAGAPRSFDDGSPHESSAAIDNLLLELANALMPPDGAPVQPAKTLATRPDTTIMNSPMATPTVSPPRK